MAERSHADRLAAVRDRRRSRSVTPATGGELVTVQLPEPPRWAPATVAATVPGIDLADWVSARLDLVDELLAAHGAVRLRGMTTSPTAFGEVVAAVARAPLADYTNRSTPRSRVTGQVFTSTEYSADHAIPMHSEQSYTTTWPRLLGFYGDLPATSGGQTPLASTAQVYDLLPADLVDRFTAHGVCYERWYHPHVDLPWQEVFQTDDPQQLARICADTGIELDWFGDDLPRTRQTAQATVRHPGTGRTVWFNQANLFHPAALPPAVAEPLTRTYADRMPRTARFGDGSPISAEQVHRIEAAFTEASWVEPWQAGDVVLVDNIAVAHGRRPYRGDRRVLVAMAGATSTDGGDR